MYFIGAQQCYEKVVDVVCVEVGEVHGGVKRKQWFVNMTHAVLSLWFVSLPPLHLI